MSIFRRVDSLALFNYGVMNGKVNQDKFYFVNKSYTDGTLTAYGHQLYLGAVPITVAPGTTLMPGSIKANDYISIDEMDGSPTVNKSDTLTTPRAITIKGNVSGTADFDGSANIEINAKLNPTVVNVTLLAANWVGSVAPFTYTLTVDGMTDTSDGSISLTDGFTDEQYTECANSEIVKQDQTANTVIIKAMTSKPTIDIPLTISFY